MRRAGDMSRRNIYVLRNLGTATKLALSLGLVLGFALFLGGWFVSVAAINWDLSWMGLVHVGTRVGMLGDDLRWLLFAVHCTVVRPFKGGERVTTNTAAIELSLVSTELVSNPTVLTATGARR